ncbi:MAG: hypothetical protein IPP95_11315 [Flavobacteriales bacterium]|nr:MAG: hypothetical protein IPP95_11315 [Flavobacteriales bacterium]
MPTRFNMSTRAVVGPSVRKRVRKESNSCVWPIVDMQVMHARHDVMVHLTSARGTDNFILV